MAKLIVIDNTSQTSIAIQSILGDTHSVELYNHGVLAADYVRDQKPAVVFLNLDLPSINSLELISLLAAIHAAPPVVAFTSNPRLDRVVAAVKNGAFDVVEHPLVPKLLLSSFARAISSGSRRLGDSSDVLVTEIVGVSAPIVRTRKTVERFAKCRAPVIITGESGVGKELVATATHRLSRFSNGHFVAVNCAAIPDSLFESEMFGTCPGGYTGARSRVGLFERAHGGTLFLDEIGELSLAAQAKLLRLVESCRFSRVGESSVRSATVRLITATNRDLRREVEEKRFREDLYYRLSVAEVAVAPLRRRKQDIPVLANHFRALIVRAEQKSVMPEFTPAAFERLASYRWPGNVRELRNVIWRTILAVDGSTIGPDDIEFGR